jgi:hypothetical protein
MNRMLDAACAEIFARWQKFVPDDQAFAQAEAFRRRFGALAIRQVLSEIELDAMLDMVADAMAAA